MFSALAAVCTVWLRYRNWLNYITLHYLPGRKASPPIGWYQIILLSDRGTCVLTTCPGLHSTAGRLGFEPATCWSQVQNPNGHWRRSLIKYGGQGQSGQAIKLFHITPYVSDFQTLQQLYGKFMVLW